MDAIGAMEKFFKAKDVYDRYQEVKAVEDYARKVQGTDFEKADRKTLRFFSNDILDEVTAAFDAAETRIDRILRTRMRWPEPETRGMYDEALRAAVRHGHQSKQVRALMQKYERALCDHQNKLRWHFVWLIAGLTRIVRKRQSAGAVRDYANTLEKAFLKVAGIPQGMSTAPNAEFWQLSEDAGHLSATAGNVYDKLGKIEQRGREWLKELDDRSTVNKLWIKWAQSYAKAGPDALKKNRNAVRPRR